MSHSNCPHVSHLCLISTPRPPCVYINPLVRFLAAGLVVLKVSSLLFVSCLGLFVGLDGSGLFSLAPCFTCFLVVFVKFNLGAYVSSMLLCYTSCVVLGFLSFFFFGCSFGHFIKGKSLSCPTFNK